MAQERRALRVRGTVQGVGYRPFVFGLAQDLGVAGFVGNDADGVFVEAEAAPEALDDFARRLATQAPPLAVVASVTTTGHLAVTGQPGFAITASSSGEGSTSIPPDTATCDACLAELLDPDDRRFGYPFIACTHCGPRYTMTLGLPYDRANTTMAPFELCAACRAEYEDPHSRRFHAQPTACADCGPRLSVPVGDVAAWLRQGRIVAIKGIGGYHLACDGRDVDAVERLRTRKGRGAKPFAVMVADLATAARLVTLDAAAAQALTSRVRPIVVGPALDDELAATVAPGTGTIGVMLPYTPLHHLLFAATDAPEVLVMTSGNVSDEPICIDAVEAEQRLAHIADAFCHHDRAIHVACDDSVVRAMATEAPQPVRRSRGHAPRPLDLPVPLAEGADVLAVGGELKTTLCVASGASAWPSQHIGDTQNLATLEMLERTADTLSELQRVRPRAIVSDAHPGYQSRAWAARRAARTGAAHLTVQHHHAHLASLLAEHAVDPSEPVLGVVFDGTGYGEDGTIWGGELLLGSYAGVQRVGHLRPILLPGGDAAITHPARTALAHLVAAGLPAAGTLPATALGDGGTALVLRMLATGSHCTPTSSAGRLFDAVAATLGVRHEVQYEGQAAIELEALATKAQGIDPQPARVGQTAEPPKDPAVRRREDGTVVIDPSSMLAVAVAAGAAGSAADVPAAALAFHEALADAVAAAVQLVAADHDVAAVGLTGGVFANAILSKGCLERLSGAGLPVLTHRVVPPNDGGLALGQVAVAAAGGAHEVLPPRP